MPKATDLNCLGCGQKKEYIDDQYCQRCEGRRDGEYYAGNVRYEVLFVAKQKNLSPICGQMLRYKAKSMNRWRKTGLNLIDCVKFNIYYQTFMKAFSRLTLDITEGAQNGQE